MINTLLLNSFQFEKQRQLTVFTTYLPLLKYSITNQINIKNIIES